MLHPFYSSDFGALISLLRRPEAFQHQIDEIFAVFDRPMVEEDVSAGSSSSTSPKLCLEKPKQNFTGFKFRQLSSQITADCGVCFDPLLADEKSLRLGCRCVIHYVCLLRHIQESLGDRLVFL